MKNKINLLSLTLLFVGLTLNAQINFQWAKSLGGPNIDKGNAITVDAAGNVYTTGSFSGLADFDPGVGVYTEKIIKKTITTTAKQVSKSNERNNNTETIKAKF